MQGLYRLRRRDLPRAREVLKDAFGRDPVWNKLFAGLSRQDAKLSAFFETPLRYCLRYGEVAATSEHLEGIAAWIPGHHSAMTAWRMIRSGAAGCALRIGTAVMRRMGPAFVPIDRDRREQMKGRAYTYLQIIGVASAQQGKGFGGRLLRAIIAQSEQDRRPLYLETETEDNVRLYERFGFRVINQRTLPGLDLPMWEMLREPDA